MKDIEEVEKIVDQKFGLNNAGAKHGHMIKRRTLKLLGVLIITAILVTTASATLLQYFAKFEATVTVEQAVTVTGGPLDFTGTLGGGCCVCTGPYTVTNNGCQPICLDLITTDITDPQKPGPVPEGLTVTVVECEGESPTPIPCYLDSIEVNILDGQATGDDDDYSVYIDGQYAGSYDATEGGSETWVVSFFDITALNIPACGTHTVKINCDATTPWSGYATWGQLAVDYVKLYRDCPTCVEPVLCDSVDIGDATDEAGHNLVGWSTFIAGQQYNGGNYGGIDDARCTWFGSETADYSWASVDLTCSCEDCGSIPGQGEECTCDDPDIRPICLKPGESINFCICYYADIMMAPGTFDLKTIVVPEQV